MSERLRFTGAWPPIDLWDRFPNWEYALDEEGTEGQDETTLRPAEVQTEVDLEQGYTAGHVTQADGTVLPALLGMQNDELVSVLVFVNERDAWSLSRGESASSWRCDPAATWIPEPERPPAVEFSDEKVFPLEIRFRLPLTAGTSPLVLTLSSEGSTES